MAASSSNFSKQLAGIGTTVATAAARQGATELEAYEKKHAPEQMAEVRKETETEYKHFEASTEYKNIEADFKEEEVRVLSLISFDFLKS